MRYVIRLIVVGCCALAGLIAGPAQAEKRLALSVGIDAYDNLPAHEQLKKAVNDARAMGTALRELGFDTQIAENVSRLAFTRTWQRFLNRLQQGDTAALFFAGHGVEIGGLNYLLPRDVPKVVPGEDRVLAEGSIRFNALMDDLRDRKVRVALFIVDACRDNPFWDGRGRSVGGTRGLARIEAAKGSFVMYSAGAGEQALDRLSDADPDPNSVYTRTLLPILALPGLSLPEIAGRVRRKVVEVARGVGRDQTPAYYDELLGDLVLKATPVAGAKPPATSLPAPLSAADRMWAVVKDTANIAALEAFRQQYGRENPVYDRLAEARIEELKKQQVAMLKVERDRKRAEDERQRADGDLLRPGRVFRDCRDVCPEMVVLPAGEFLMGSPPGEVGRRSDEGPQRRVTIARPFAVAKFEATFAEWDVCVTNGGCKHRPGDQGWGRGRRPVINLSWHQAKEYVAWLSRKTGKAYRLLSEAEWEYAARAGTATRYAFGDAISKSQAQHSADMTVEVGSFPANMFGLHDLHDNVWEWVEDAWHPNYEGAPLDGSVWLGGDVSQRVLRGGSWHYYGPDGLRSADRSRSHPDYRYGSIGFRVARTL
jgi:formylglycine-generating enzyme required for sulfatase activity